MKLLFFAAFVTVAAASQLLQEPRPYDPAPAAFAASVRSSPSANEASINAANAKRQHAVNRIALHYGVSIGTAPYYGVPGTSVKGIHNSAYGYGHNRPYGYGSNAGYGYGHNRIHHSRFGHGFGYGHVGNYAAPQAAYGHGHLHSHLPGLHYHTAQALGPSPSDQPAGPSPGDQAVGPSPFDQDPGPSPADQLTGPTVADQEAGPTAADQAARPADPAPSAFNAIYAIAPSHNEAEINKNNAKRQHAVNRIALYYGRSVGTAPYYGVPGTVIKGRHNGGPYDGSYGYSALNNGVYGYGGYGGYGGRSSHGHGLLHHTFHGAHPLHRGYPGAH